MGGPSRAARLDALEHSAQVHAKAVRTIVGHLHKQGSDQAVVAVAARWVTRKNVNALRQEHAFTRSIDLLSMDVDGNDFWIWEALTVASPRVVVIEFNRAFGTEPAVVVPYDPAFDRHLAADRRYDGASLAALTTLAVRKGCRLVLVEPHGVNAFFLRADVGPDLPAWSPGWLAPDSRDGEDPIAFCARLGLSLVDVSH